MLRSFNIVYLKTKLKIIFEIKILIFSLNMHPIFIYANRIIVLHTYGVCDGNERLKLR